jgi:hypothetical protein
MKNRVENYSSRLEQMKQITLGLKDTIDIKEKTEEYLGKRLKNYKRSMHELSNSIKRPNLQIRNTEEEEEEV